MTKSRSETFVRGHLLATPDEVARAWRFHCPSTATPAGMLTIPAEYAVATADHESGFALDEVDTEPSGFTSFGIFQLSSEEARDAGMPDADLLDLDQAAEVLARISIARMLEILGECDKRSDGSLDRAMKGDLYAYLTVAHNQGLGAALKTIQAHGLDWRAYKDRNLTAAMAACDAASTEAAHVEAASKLKWWQKVAAYGNDCISGGPRWAEVR